MTFAVLLGCAGALHGAEARESAPRFSATTLSGERFTNDVVKGRVVLVQFWATWCGYCRREQEAVDTLAKEFEKKGLLVLAVNVGESKKKVAQYLKESPRACPIVLMENTNLAAIYGPRAFPLYIVIDKDGKVAGRQDGAGGEEALRDLLGKAGLEPE